MDNQLRPEQREIHQRRGLLAVIALRRQLPQPLLRIEETSLPNLRLPPALAASVNQHVVGVTGGFLEVSIFFRVS